MTIDQAVELAQRDVAEIRTAAADATPESALLVDGSMYAPSWRALDGGSAVWEETGTHDGSAYDAFDAYVDTLNAGTDELGAFWSDGCLLAACALHADDDS